MVAVGGGDRLVRPVRCGCGSLGAVEGAGAGGCVAGPRSLVGPSHRCALFAWPGASRAEWSETSDGCLISHPPRLRCRWVNASLGSTCPANGARSERPPRRPGSHVAISARITSAPGRSPAAPAAPTRPPRVSAWRTSPEAKKMFMPAGGRKKPISITARSHPEVHRVDAVAHRHRQQQGTSTTMAA